MLETKIRLNEATKIDFTGKLAGFQHFQQFNEDTVSLIRSLSGTKLIAVIDYGYGIKTPHMVRDHLNLTGDNPLRGANNPCGERFPSVNDIYVFDESLPSGIAAGLRSGIKPSGDDIALIQSLGADFYCYNLIPTMIVAAHAKHKVVAIMVPEDFDTAKISALINKLESKK